MPTLMLLRHAKAVPHERGDDFDRGLAERGEADAEALGRHMARLGVVPDLALVSAAVRTRSTFERFARSAGIAIEAHVEQSLYNASGRELRDTLKLVDDKVGTLMIVAHNPGIMDAAVDLARDGDFEDLVRLRGRFPPCALAVITCVGHDWRDARANGGRLDLLLMPDDLVHG